MLWPRSSWPPKPSKLYEKLAKLDVKLKLIESLLEARVQTVTRNTLYVHLLFWCTPDSRLLSHSDPDMEDAGGSSSVGGSDASAYDGMTVEACEAMIQKSFKLPMVKFLREKLEEAGCPVRNRFFKAMMCTDKVSGGYMTGKGVVVCSNHLTIQDEVNQVIIHELIHAYDDCRAANMNWTNCAHHACSEIRAAHLSGDCHFKRELLRGHTKLRGHEQECIKRRVLMSLANNPYCSGPTAKNAMEAVWDICYKDTKPFDRAP